jgi:hypothetical protein
MSKVQDPASIPNEKGPHLRKLKRCASPTFPKQRTKRQNFVPKDVILHKGKPFTYKPTDAKSQKQNEENIHEKYIFDVCKVCAKEFKSLLRHLAKAVKCAEKYENLDDLRREAKLKNQQKNQKKYMVRKRELEEKALQSG